MFIDNLVYDPKQDCGAYPAKYPSSSAWSAAMLSFVKAAWSGLHAHGYYVALNAIAYVSGNAGSDDGSLTAAWWRQLAPYASGLMNEYYDETATSTRQPRAIGPAWSQHWDGWARLIGVAQNAGDDWIGLTKQSCTDTAAMTYGKASFLLEWDGGDSTFIYTCGTTDPGNSAWTTDIGIPLAAKVAVGVGYERSYTRGTVLVNPSPSVSQTFAVGGVSYTLAPRATRRSSPSGRCVRTARHPSN